MSSPVDSNVCLSSANSSALHIYSVRLAHYVNSPPEPCKIGTQADSMHVSGKHGRQLCGLVALSCAWFYKHFSFRTVLKSVACYS